MATATARAAYRYVGTARRLVIACKYRGIALAAAPLADGMVAAAARSPSLLVDAVVPVPGARRRGRRFDHAELLGEHVARDLGVPLWRGRLKRRGGLRQAGLGAAERRANVAGVFRASRAVAGARLLLVDDVLTTGATASACARACHDAGATWIAVVAASRATLHADG